MRRQSGFSYVLAMFLVAVMTTMAMRGFEVTLTKEKREKEAQLMEVGGAYRAAIRSYYENSPGTAKQYPESLEALLLDSRTSTTRRHLRKLYADPMTGSRDWGLDLAPDGRIAGVYSLSTRKPVKVGAFAVEMASATGASTYADWKFSYRP